MAFARSAPPAKAVRPWVALAVVILGGSVGVALRAALTLPFSAAAHPLVVPAITLGINVIGSLLLGVVVGWLDHRHPLGRLFLGTGVIGGFTTYSAFAVQGVTTSSALPIVGLALIGASIFGGVLAAALGLVWGRRIAGVPGEIEPPEDAE